MVSNISQSGTIRTRLELSSSHHTRMSSPPVHLGESYSRPRSPQRHPLWRLSSLGGIHTFPFFPDMVPSPQADTAFSSLNESIYVCPPLPPDRALGCQVLCPTHCFSPKLKRVAEPWGLEWILQTCPLGAESGKHHRCLLPLFRVLC